LFVEVTRRRNPALVEVAVELHRRGQIPPNTYVIDVDTVEQNAAAVASAATAAGLETLQMTKQFGRNPVVAAAAERGGIPEVVAVDFECARVLHAFGLKIGHLGHLVQIPSTDRTAAMRLDPRQVTVFDIQQAAAIGEVAAAMGRTQGVLLRVVAEGDIFYPAQRGGIPEYDLVTAAKAVDDIDGVKVIGVTSFPCLMFDPDAGEVSPTPNLSTVAGAAQTLRDEGFEISVVNTPSMSTSATVGILADHGSTQIEPGSCLIGHTPLHAVSDEPELPAMVYVSEISHRYSDCAYAFGGGFYPRSRAKTALVFTSDGSVHEAGVELDPPDAIDYHGTLHVDPALVKIGDTVIYAFRSQVFVAHSWVAPVSGLASGAPVIEGLFTERGWPVTEDLVPAAFGGLQ
jgi:predicted amino acid racemase